MKKFQDKLRNEDDIMDLLTTDFPNGLFEPLLYGWARNFMVCDISS